MYKYIVSFDENGDEYIGHTYITSPSKLVKTGDRTIEMNGVKIEYDENINNILLISLNGMITNKIIFGEAQNV